MVVSPEILKSVVFLGCENHVDNTYFYFGTAFFLGLSDGNGHCSRVCLVTARHVIEKIRETCADNVCVRLNLKDGNSKWVKTDIKKWYFPENDRLDIALFERGTAQDEDHLFISHDALVRSDTVQRFEMGLGDEVFITGLFRFHKGRKRNIPIVRVGHLACVDSELVETERFGEIEAYLIEARSLGGLSGSPVFLNLGQMRVIKGKLEISPTPSMWLLGLVHGHYAPPKHHEYDPPAKAEPGQIDDAERLNVGIAIIVPSTLISEAFFEYLEKHPSGI